MNFDALENNNIMLLGKSRALSGDEFARQLKNHNIHLVEDKDADVALIIEGRLVNPIEQDLLASLYAEKVAPMIEIADFEKWLCQSIDGPKLLMSLKLSGDHDRLMGYLQNPYISNGLFLRLLQLYNWEGLGFFESDENRDITAALISRFYENIERNHNVQYANMGIMHLLNQSRDVELTETIALLSPLQTALKEGCENSTQKILNAIALHPSTSEKVLKQWLKKGDDKIQMLIAMRHDLDLKLQQNLLYLNKEIINETLSLNPSIEQEIALILLATFPENITKHIDLDEPLYLHLLEQYALELAQNPTLTSAMQKELLGKDEDVRVALAGNAKIDGSVFQALFESGNVEVLRRLIANPLMPSDSIKQLFEKEAEVLGADIAANARTDVEILKQLAHSDDVKVLLALAKNPSTPIGLLYQFQLDRRLERAVKENPSFGKHIQRDNIGWDV
ncbi:MAG: hypothetical protein MUP09_12350 [Thiovulaceae bacterium]|nr:hypothetical protein [Sulfurimonadaceae bacterium]